MTNFYFFNKLQSWWGHCHRYTFIIVSFFFVSFYDTSLSVCLPWENVVCFTTIISIKCSFKVQKRIIIMMKYLFQIVIVITFLNSSFGQVNKISKKGSKYAMLNQKLRKLAITTPLPTTTSTTPTTTEDPFFSSDDDIFSDFDDAFDGEFLWQQSKVQCLVCDSNH